MPALEGKVAIIKEEIQKWGHGGCRAEAMSMAHQS